MAQICAKCGSRVEDGTPFCPGCGATMPVSGAAGAWQGYQAGAPTGQGAPHASQTYGAPADKSSACSFGGAAAASGYTSGGAGYASHAAPTAGDSFQAAVDAGTALFQTSLDRTFGTQQPMPVTGELPMKWYTFNVMFALWISALLSGLMGIASIAGTQYGAFSELYYTYFGGLQIIDIIFGAASVALAVITVYVRQELAHYKRVAPTHFMALPVLNFALSVLDLVVSFIFGSELSAGIGILSIIPLAISGGFTILYLYLNKIYFDKRAHLFCR